MCGVVGVYAYAAAGPVVDRQEVRAVRDHMAARGPDGSGEWFSPDGRAALAHRRLSIIDLSPRAAQPMASANGRLVLSFNGEIYNFRELRSQLQAQGRVFRTDSDTEVLLQLYEAHGTGMLEMLRGMFAFALWDGARRAMLLARDAFGIKPLYYADDGRTVRAASQVKALLQAPVDTTPEPAGHAGFFLWGSVPSPWTLYRGIRAVPAGHFMWVGERGAAAPQPYCLISDILAEAVAQPAQGSSAQALEHIAHALDSSVRAHLVSDVPVGVFLSAGLDSAVVSALATRSKPPRTLTLGFAEYAGTLDDEVPLAELIASTLGTSHTTMTCRRSDFEADREHLLAAMDQPSIDGVNTWFVARAAATQGIKVALSGLGGDELFGSYPSFHDVPRMQRLAGPFARLRGLGIFARRLSEPLLRRVTSPKFAGLLEYGGSLGGAYMLRRGLYMPWELPRVMDPDMAREGWRDLQVIARLNDLSQSVSGKGASRLAITAMEMCFYMRHQLLRDADWAGMAHSVEIRTPLLDLPLLKAVAPWIAAHPQLTKQRVAMAAAPELPCALLQQPKTGFTVPVREWLGADSKASRGLRGWAGTVHASLQGAGPVSPGKSAAPAGAARRAPRVLVSTLGPGHGGVSAMTAFVVRNLAARGCEPVIAHYAPYSVTPTLSVPSFRLLQRRPGWLRSQGYDNREVHAIGAWLPELEFTHYLPTAHWRRLMESCDAGIAVAGNVLAATPFLKTGRPCLAWVASDWLGDRRDRVRRYPFVRRVLDTVITTPVNRLLERKLLQHGHVLSLSAYTAGQLATIAGPEFRKVILPVPVDAEFFVPRPAACVPGRLGFAGRFNDPRKNIGLLLHCVAQMRRAGNDVSLLLMGDASRPEILGQVEALGIAAHVEIRSGLSREAMRDCMQTLDVFVLPSHQEGLCISALEAFACGVPVVSTRCGGPEEFVIPGRTGLLVDPTVDAMAAATRSLTSDRPLRETMSAAARRLVEERYGISHADAIFQSALDETFPALAARTAQPRPAPVNDQRAHLLSQAT